MKICYVAKHGNGANGDEGAITYALEQLGHAVTCVRERDSVLTTNGRSSFCDFLAADLVLSHKWSDWAVLSAIKIPKVSWYFDLVEYPSDPTLRGRDTSRREWMQAALPLVDLMFCTDGEWVRNAGTYELLAPHAHKLHWLMQGADERITFFGSAADLEPVDILFTGSVYKCGKERSAFVQDMTARYGERFHWVNSGPGGSPVYRRQLTDLIASARVVVAPDSPVAPAYWSNRAYVTLGFGGFFLHPQCGLTEHYADGKEVLFYRDKEQLYSLIEESLARTDSDRAGIKWAALERTREEHLYRHRVEELLRVVKEKVGVS